MSVRLSYGLQVPAGPISDALRGAGAEARAKRYEAAVALQRRALELGRRERISPETAVVIELTLGSYQLHLAMNAPERAEEAAATLESVIWRSRLHGMEHERLHAKTGLATARTLQGRHADAAEVHLRAASVAKQLGDTLAVGDFLRSAGDALFAAGDRPRAVARWRAALPHLCHAPEDFATLDERSVVLRLIELGREVQLDGLVRRYRSVLERLQGAPGAN